MSTHRTTTRGVGQAIRNGEPAQNSSGSFRFDGRFVWSYDEPIGYVADDGRVFRTTAKFSVTTSKHCGQVPSVEPDGEGGYRRNEIDHGALRQMVRDAGLGGALGRYGARYDADYTPRTNIALGASR